MKKWAAVCGLSVILWASNAGAGLDLTWNACNVDGGIHDITAACANPAGSNILVGSFQSPSTLAACMGMDAFIDLQSETAGIAPFWHFEDGGCNASGIEVSSQHALLGSTCTAPSPWTAGADATIIAYGAGLGGPNRARLAFSITETTPVPITASQNYYAFHLRFLTANATEAGGTCSGCAGRFALVWNEADLYNSGPGPPFLQVTAAGSSGDCAGWNTPSGSTCSTTPVRNRTWGAIKRLYR